MASAATANNGNPFLTWRDAKLMAARIDQAPGWSAQEIVRHAGGPTEGTESHWYYVKAHHAPGAWTCYIYRAGDWPWQRDIIAPAKARERQRRGG